MRLYKERSQHLHLSRHNNSPFSSKFVGILITAWGIGLLYTSFYNIIKLTDPELRYPVYLFCGALIIVRISIFAMGLKKDIAPKNPLLYAPGLLAKKRLASMIIGVLFMMMFCSIFISVGLRHQIMFLVVGSIFLLITLIGAVLETKSLIQLFKKKLKFGATSINILSGKINRGDTISIKIKNPEFYDHLKSIDLILRNLEERWEARDLSRPQDKNNSELLRTYILAESQRRVDLSNFSQEIEIDIPFAQSKKTDYNLKNPIYWELEISNKSEQYWARFYLNVA